MITIFLESFRESLTVSTCVLNNCVIDFSLLASSVKAEKLVKDIPLHPFVHWRWIAFGDALKVGWREQWRRD